MSDHECAHGAPRIPPLVVCADAIECFPEFFVAFGLEQVAQRLLVCFDLSPPRCRRRHVTAGTYIFCDLTTEYDTCCRRDWFDFQRLAKSSGADGVMICGDFNMTPDSALYHYMVKGALVVDGLNR